MSVTNHSVAVAALLVAIACAASAVSYRTVVVFGDTQALVVERQVDPSESYLRFLEMTRWVAEHRESENIDFVLHVGDITQHGSVCAIAVVRSELASSTTMIWSTIPWARTSSWVRRRVFSAL